MRIEECPRRAETVASEVPLSSICDATVCRRRCSPAPLGFRIFSRLNNNDTVAEIESGFNGVPFGLAKIRSRSVLYSGPNCFRNSSWRLRCASSFHHVRTVRFYALEVEHPIGLRERSRDGDAATHHATGHRQAPGAG